MVFHWLFACKINNFYPLVTVPARRQCLKLNEEQTIGFIEGQSHLRTFLACRNEFDAE
jgi:hypothetical protein